MSQDKEGESWIEKFRNEHPDPGDDRPVPAPTDEPPAGESAPPPGNWLHTKTDVIQRIPRERPADAQPRYDENNPAIFVPDVDAQVQATVTRLVENLPASVHRTMEHGRTSLYIYGLKADAMNVLAKKLDDSAVACQIKGLNLSAPPVKAVDPPGSPVMERLRRILLIVVLMAVTGLVFYLLTSHSR